MGEEPVIISYSSGNFARERWRNEEVITATRRFAVCLLAVGAVASGVVEATLSRKPQILFELDSWAKWSIFSFFVSMVVNIAVFAGCATRVCINMSILAPRGWKWSWTTASLYVVGLIAVVHLPIASPAIDLIILIWAVGFPFLVSFILLKETDQRWASAAN